jgi:1,4-dihydroxy-2-naphthoate octaprenyltransferase
MERLRPWLDALKPEQALLAPLAVAVGSGYAAFDARAGAGLPGVLLVLPASLLAGCGVNLIGHAWDRIGAPPGDPKNPIPESERPVDGREAAVAGGAALATAALLGLASASFVGGAWLGYAALAIGLGVLRGAPGLGPDTIGFGLGELCNLLALGPLAVLAGFAASAGEGSSGAFFAGLPVGFIAGTPLFARHFTRTETDARLMRVTPVVSLGLEAARGLLIASPLVAAAAVILTARAGEYPAWARAAVVPLAVAAAAAWRTPKNPDAAAYARWGRLASACALAALASLAVALRFASRG